MKVIDKILPVLVLLKRTASEQSSPVTFTGRPVPEKGPDPEKQLRLTGKGNLLQFLKGHFFTLYLHSLELFYMIYK